MGFVERVYEHFGWRTSWKCRIETLRPVVRIIEVSGNRLELKYAVLYFPIMRLFFDVFRPVAKLRKATFSLDTSVRPHGETRLPLDRFSWNLIFEHFFWKYVEKIQVSFNSVKINGYVTWRPVYVMIVSRWIFLKMRSVSDKNYSENQFTHLMFRFFRKSCRLWDNAEKCGRVGKATDDNAIRRRRFGYWIAKAPNRVKIFNTAFPRQELLRELTSVLRYTYIVSSWW